MIKEIFVPYIPFNDKACWNLTNGIYYNLQSCTEMVAPSCSTGKTDMFEKSDWDFSAYTNGCLKNWKVKPNINWIETQYWGKNLSAASNIIFRSVKRLYMH